MLITERKLLVLADKVVNRYVLKGVIPNREWEDTTMLIVEKFLLQQDKIKQHYLGKANITTYCISVLNNMCCEIIRKELKHWKNELNEVPERKDNHSFSASKDTIIQDEIKYLDKIIKLYGSEKYKVNIVLCYYYRLSIQIKDLISYRKNIYVDLQTIDAEDKINKSEMLNNLAIFVSKVENKQMKADAIRMWINKTINYIIDRLNSPFNRANYDKESFQVLYELYNAQRSQSSK